MKEDKYCLKLIFEQNSTSSWPIYYERNYNPRLVYLILLSHFWRPFLCFQGSFSRKCCPRVWLVFKRGLWSRAGYDGARTVLKTPPLRSRYPYCLYLLNFYLELIAHSCCCYCSVFTHPLRAMLCKCRVQFAVEDFAMCSFHLPIWKSNTKEKVSAKRIL